MNSAELRIGEWSIDGPGCRIDRNGESRSLEPKVMDLLLLLSQSPDEVVSRPWLLSQLWPGVVVGDDTLARTVSKLRAALDDNVRHPAYIETIPKRGYRLIAKVSSGESTGVRGHRHYHAWIAAGLVLPALLLAGLLLSGRGSDAVMESEAALLTGRADDFYMRFSRAGNAAAIDLYERVIAVDPGHARAYAGLASALVQRVVRWPDGGSGVSSVGAALAAGMHEGPQARELLGRAQSLAERAVELSADDPKAHNALGLVLATSGRLEEARRQYARAIALDEDAWESFINLGELAALDGDSRAAIRYFSRGYEAMQRLYDREPQRIGPWHASLGVVIGGLYEDAGEFQDAEAWYRRILRLSPYDEDATGGLARILARSGDPHFALSLCRNLLAVGGSHQVCEELLAGSATHP